MKNNINFIQIQKMTEEEEFDMYMKLSKEEIIKMLIQCNKSLNDLLDTNFKNTFAIDEQINDCQLNDANTQSSMETDLIPADGTIGEKPTYDYPFVSTATNEITINYTNEQEYR